MIGQMLNRVQLCDDFFHALSNIKTVICCRWSGLLYKYSLFFFCSLFVLPRMQLVIVCRFFFESNSWRNDSTAHLAHIRLWCMHVCARMHVYTGNPNFLLTKALDPPGLTRACWVFVWPLQSVFCPLGFFLNLQNNRLRSMQASMQAPFLSGYMGRGCGVQLCQ